VLYHALLRAGYSVGEILFLLNRSSHARATESFPYVLFGAPEQTLAGATRRGCDYDLRETAAGVEVAVESAAGPVVDVTIPGSLLDDGASELLVRPAGDGGGHPRYYSAVREDGDVRLLLYENGPVKPSTFTVELVDQRAFAPDIEVLRESVYNSFRLELFDVLNTRTTEQVTELRDSIGEVSASYLWARREVAAVSDFSDKLDSLTGDVAGIHEALRTRVAESGQLKHVYADGASVADVSAMDDRCRRCGRRLYAKTVMDGSWQCFRVFADCPLCGTRFDVPSDPTYDVPSRLAVSGPLLDLDSDGTGFEVAVRNDTPTHTLTTVFPWVISLDPDSVDFGEYVTPASRTETLAPGDCRTYAFEVDASLLADNEYKLFVYVLTNVEVSMVYEPFVVGDQPGFKPSHRL